MPEAGSWMLEVRGWKKVRSAGLKNRRICRRDVLVPIIRKTGNLGNEEIRKIRRTEVRGRMPEDRGRRQEVGGQK